MIFEKYKTDRASESTQVVLLAIQLDILGHESGFEDLKGAAGQTVFLGWQNVEIYPLRVDTHSMFCPARLAFSVEYDGFLVHKMLSPFMFPYFPGLLLRKQMGQETFWKKTVIEVTVLTVFQ